MNRHPRTLAIAAATLVASGALLAVAYGQSRAPKAARASSAPPARHAAPASLASASRTARIKAAFKAAGLQALEALPKPPEMRLTPVAPKLANGAEIIAAGPGVFMGADQDEPDGAFLLQHATVRLRFPTVAQKVYVLDCRFEMFGQAPFSVAVTRPGASLANLPVDAGHIFHAFQASGATTAINLTVVPQGNFPAAGYFYGCDFGKAN